jgi:hypothetical protein
MRTILESKLGELMLPCTGGAVENAGPDVDCYKEFCQSDIGRSSNACNTGQVRLFNVNESESLGA